MVVKIELWVVTLCSTVVGYQCFRGPWRIGVSPQPRRTQFIKSSQWYGH